MGVSSIVPFHEVSTTWRLDAEFYRPEFLKYERLVEEQGDSLTDLFSRIVQPAEFVREYVSTDHGASFWTAQNIRRGHIEVGNVRKIDWNIYRCIPNSHVSEGDVLIVRTGANAGDCAVVPSGITDVAVSSHTLRLIPKSKAMGYAVAVFFASDFGRNILLRATSGSSRPQITIDSLKSIIFPDFSAIAEESQAKIESYYEKVRESKDSYAEAESLLLQSLGLDKVDLSNRLTYTASFSEADSARRLDAEYFQPKYKRVREAMKTLNPVRIVPLDSIASFVTNGQTPRYHDLSVGEVPFLTAEHVYDFRLDFNSEKRILNEHHTGLLQRTQLSNNDLLITIKGKVGNAAVVENISQPTNINQDVALIRLKEGIPPYYVAAFLNSFLGKALTEQVSTGQINPFLSLGGLRQIPIPLYEATRLEELAELVQSKVRQAYEAKQESESLLEQAKHRVEEMILQAAK